MNESAASARGAGTGAAPSVQVEGYEGPIDLLLELAQRQRVDLGRLSLIALIDQFVAKAEDPGLRVPLERRGDWVVVASGLVLLRSRLLVPASAAEAEAAEREAAAQLRQLDELARMRAAAAWLQRRPQLGRDLLPRGRIAPPETGRAQRHLAFLEALLVLLEGRAARPGAAPPLPPPPPLLLFRLADAMARLRALLAAEEAPLSAFLPPLPPPGPGQRTRARAAVASTFLAALELARDGGATLRQEADFAPILLRRAA